MCVVGMWVRFRSTMGDPPWFDGRVQPKFVKFDQPGSGEFVWVGNVGPAGAHKQRLGSLLSVIDQWVG